MAETYDMVIAGGSMVGATLANALAASGLRIAVVEASSETGVQPGAEYDLRVSAVTEASRRLFETLEVWPAMVARRVSPFREMEVWDAAGSGRIHFDGADIGVDALGYIVENRVIQAALIERLERFDDIDLIRPGSVEHFVPGADHVEVELDNGTALHGRLLVGADGARSRVRTEAGIPVRGWDYEQTAVVATVKTERPHHETAWQRFLPTGPLAFLPLRDGYCSIVWSTDPAQAQVLLELDDAGFCQQLSQAFDGALGAVLSTSRRAGFPLRLQHARSYVASRLALVGDAAHTIHPLAGQGVNLGLLDAAALAEVVYDSWRRGRDPGEFMVLRRYERWRKGDNLAMMSVMDGFKRLFGARGAALRQVRNLGLSLVDHVAPVKQSIMRRAMGTVGDLPRLARGLKLG
jgi:2-octaprenylphenol hydroxylase